MLSFSTTLLVLLAMQIGYLLLLFFYPCTYVFSVRHWWFFYPCMCFLYDTDCSSTHVNVFSLQHWWFYYQRNCVFRTTLGVLPPMYVFLYDTNGSTTHVIVFSVRHWWFYYSCNCVFSTTLMVLLLMSLCS